ncbi:protein kinase domain-containing protein [Actinomycetospora sp. CA-101289]|uniref:protein kinase domain-containing protein n=1 Tax=Actinomycetospora sp. CA-101289 TaxID=3239893 RepID=UPI003D9511C7
MKATSPRWHEVGESEHDGERRALAYVRELLPDPDPWAAWARFTFASEDGRARECDVLVAGPEGLHLIEIKSWRGHLSNDGPHWTRGGRPEGNPLPLLEQKSKELRSYLAHEAALIDTALRVPFVQASLFLSEPGMRSSLDRYARAQVFAPDDAVNDLPRVGRDLLLARATQSRPSPRFLELLPSLLHSIGIASGLPSRTVGAWTIDRQPYDEGPTWQDFHAGRADIDWNPHRRVRIYLEAKRSDETVRRSIRHAAEREFQVAAGVRHPGILAPSEFEEHELGPALIIEQERDAERLDHWLARHREELSEADRIGLVRQLASAVAYAHRRGLVHRALSPRAVLMESGVLRVGEWQVATRDMATRRSPRRAAPTSMSAGHLDLAVEPYLAPDFVTEGVDGTIDVDIFGVGAIAYLVLSGEPPAETRPALNQRLTDEGCLDPKTGNEALDAIVRDATRPSLSERTSSVEDVLRALQEAARSPRKTGPKPAAPPVKDPLDARTGDVLPGGYRVEKVLGTGSVARAFLVRRDGGQNVLKIGRNAEAERLLTAEAAALEDLRHDHIVVLRRPSFAIGDRRAIELSNAGERTLADVLTADGPLRGERLRVAGDQLLSAVGYLADRGVFHRDVKPSNVGMRADRDPFRLALFDFSLAAAPRDDVVSGTRGYLDPHLGVGHRTTYDLAAEQYAVAATLHELASGTTPRWGDDGTAAAFVPSVTLDDAAFDPAVRGALATFLRRALAKAAADRFASVEEMRDAWNAVFAAPPVTVHAPVVTGLDVHVDVVNQLRRLDAAARDRTVDALQRASTPTPRLVAPVGARDDRMRLLPADDVTGVVLLADGAERGLLIRLDAPEAAALWAGAHAASVNEVSGELELRDAVALDRLAESFAATDADLYGHVTDEQFRRLGVDERIADWARGVPSVAELERAQTLIPPAQYAVLLSLARGVPVDDLLRGPVGPAKTEEPVDPDDLGAAVERSAGQIAMLEDLEELRQLLERPISQFATFLHPSQRKLAYKPNWGSTQVTGGPGTGKTVVALHRVKYLVERADLGAEKVLLTTFTKGLAEALERDLGQMLNAERLASVKVINIDRWAHSVVRDQHGRLAMLDDKDADARWRRAAAEAGTTQTPAFLDAEWEQVVLAQQITSEAEYLACERRGRGKPLPASQRAPVWRAIESFAEGLRADSKWTYMTIADEAARLLAAEDTPYEHVVVDEIQDLHPAHWRLLRVAVKPKPEDLFLTGDPHQRIYGHRVSLKTVGINIGGRRSTKLSLSYRTSAEILAWALRMLGDHHETGLDDVADDLASYRSAFSGSKPEVVGASTREEEMAELAEAVRQWHEDGIDWEDIAVVGRGQHIWRSAASALRKADVPVVELRKAAGESAVRVGTMHGLKGLEFRAVAVVGVSDGVIPRAGITPAEEDEIVHRNAMQDERNLLFVAATRPRERLRVSWHGAPSPFLPPS